ncbi:hypothetical protein RHSIM_RhsimUnG0128400 [Rhododendron simsii]|uniref:Protein kinase domain-containing protein n=1 Tax=Rhododendron simsii TaxID=118357 RepID=A0A834FX22_RHOSS|nr:hypothetical protein RHSIM_RhsimUnG0128400 [Rhododendron simsii]
MMLIQHRKDPEGSPTRRGGVCRHVRSMRVHASHLCPEVEDETCYMNVRNDCPKISDFGLAKPCPQKESIISLTGARGTTGYIAPEVFSRNFGGISHKSDVYSYGMMVLEMVGGRNNISVEVDHTSEIYFPHWIYKRLELDEELGLHGIMDEDDEANASARKMIIVGLWCIQTNPSNRPSMSRIVEMLEGSTESLQIPPKPYLSSPSRAPVDSSTTHVMTL